MPISSDDLPRIATLFDQLKQAIDLATKDGCVRNMNNLRAAGRAVRAELQPSSDGWDDHKATWESDICQSDFNSTIKAALSRQLEKLLCPNWHNNAVAKASGFLGELEIDRAAIVPQGSHDSATIWYHVDRKYSIDGENSYVVSEEHDSIMQALTGTAALADVHLQVLRRVLFDVDTVGAAEFRLYHLHVEMRKVRQQMEAASAADGRGARRPTAWELVSAGMKAAADASNYPNLSRLLAAYRALTQGQAATDAPAAEARLADQLYRLSASLCPDGCLACLHRSSQLMPDAHTALSVSRGLLWRYREYVLEPLTLPAAQELPSEADVQQRIREHGLCRVLAALERYDSWRQQLAARGFQPGEFDPIGRRVVCLRS